MENKEDALRFFKGIICGVILTSVLIVTKNGYDAKHAVFKENNMDIGEKASVIASMLEQNYIGDFEKNGLADQMYCGMANAMGDPYTVYMNEEQMQNFITKQTVHYAV